MNISYCNWLNNTSLDIEIRKELMEIEKDFEEIEDRFYKDLEFGTGGIRGLIGAGTNRINIYTIRRISYGLAIYLNKKLPNKINSVVIAYDTRNKSKEFAMETAKTLASCGIKVYLYEDVRTTPQLSFSVRYLNASAGVVITASHNPKEYNGFKVYGSDGCQVCLNDANLISNEISKILEYSNIPTMKEEDAIAKNLIIPLNEEIDKLFLDTIKKQIIREDIIKRASNKLKIVYTPLHGTGSVPVERVLREVGFDNLFIVEEQKYPDKDFSTVKYPNPEEKDSFTYAINLAKKEDAHIIIATDPDCDRVGVAVKNSEQDYVLLNGNQVGALLVNYIITNLKALNCLEENSIILKSIVTSELGACIARRNKISCIDTLTGFKFIGEKVEEYENSKEKKFLIGYEESLGYLIGNHCRDKDGVVTSLLVCEMATYYLDRNISIYDGLVEIYKDYGYYEEHLESITIKGIDGLYNIQNIMEYFRKYKIEDIDLIKVIEVKDYKKGIDNLPKSDVIKYILEDYSWIALRPSGTELLQES